MANDSSPALTPEQAKARLRQAAQQASPVTWLQHHPWRATSLALIGGIIVGRSRQQSGILDQRVTQLLIPVAVSGLARLLRNKYGASVKRD